MKIPNDDSSQQVYLSLTLPVSYTEWVTIDKPLMCDVAYELCGEVSQITGLQPKCRRPLYIIATPYNRTRLVADPATAKCPADIHGMSTTSLICHQLTHTGMVKH